MLFWMRITGGKYTNRRIICPKGVIRPAMDRMRESLFSILGDLTGRSFLDLFSGSGIMGIEAASRGAAPVVCVEKDGKKKNTLKENLKIVDSEAAIVIMSAEKYLKTAGRTFDIVFLDPPFPYENKQKLLEMADQADILNQEGLMMMHYPSEDNIPEKIGRFCRYRIKKYGRSLVGFYRL